MRQCSKCQKPKELTEYSKDGRGGRRSACRTCCAEQRKLSRGRSFVSRTVTSRANLDLQKTKEVAEPISSHFDSQKELRPVKVIVYRDEKETSHDLFSQITLKHGERHFNLSWKPGKNAVMQVFTPAGNPNLTYKGETPEDVLKQAIS